MKFNRIIVSILLLLTSYLPAQAQCDLNFDFVNTGSNMTVLYTLDAVNDIDVVSDLGTIGAFYQTNSGDYVCASSTEYSGSQAQLPLMADDSTTPGKDGFSDGETIYWFFQSTSGALYEMETNPADVFVLNSISIISSVELSELDCNSTGGDCEPLETEYTNTGANMTMFVTPSAAASLSGIGNGVIAVYFSNNLAEVCGGSIEFDGSQNSFPAMGDDATTPEKDGFTYGDEITWKFQADNGAQYSLNPSPNDVFSLNAISFVSSFTIEQTCEGEPETIEGCTDNQACNYNASANLNDGSCEYASDGFDCNGTCTSGDLLTFGGGSWISETMFVISDCEGNVLLEDGGEVLSMCVDLPDNYTISMTDSYGDGWQGNVLTIGDADFTLNYGSQGSSVVGSCGTSGCTNSTSCNYDSNATIDDGSCEYHEEGYDCDLDCIDYDGNGICDESGCTSSTSCNYNPDATIDDGSCEYAEDGYDCEGNCLSGESLTVNMYDSYGDGWNGNTLTIGGSTVTLESGSEGTAIICVDMSACNAIEVGGGSWEYEVSWSIGDLEGVVGSYQIGTCAVVGCTDESAENYNAEATEDDGLCEYAIVQGCTDADACNYDEAAEDDNGSCEYAVEFYDCNGDCLEDEDADGVCDWFEIAGCTDISASNYNSDATDDDNSCVYDSDCGCTDLNYIEYYTQGFIADCDNGSCEVLTESYGITPEHFNNPMNTSVNMTLGFELDNIYVLEGAQIAAFSDLDGDGVISTDMNVNGFGDIYYECIGIASFENEFFAMPMWGDDPLSDEVDGAPLGSQEIIFAILTSDGEVIAFNPEPEFYGFEPNGLVVFDNLNLDVTVYGCMNPAYCNYNEYAEEDDGSCEGLFGCTEEFYMEYDANASCQLDEACVVTWQSAFEIVEAELNEMNLYNTDLLEELNASNQANSVLSSDLEAQMSISATLSEELNIASETIVDYEDQVQSLLSLMSSLNEDLDYANMSIDDLEDQVAELTIQNSNLNNQNNELIAANNQLANALSEANTLISDLEAQIDEQTIQNSNLNNQNNELIADNNELENVLSEATTLIFNLEAQVDELQAYIDMADSVIDEQANSILDQLSSISDLESQVSLANASIIGLEEQVVELSSDNSALEAQLVSSNDMNTSLTIQVEELILENENMTSVNDSLSSPIYIDLIPGWNIIGFTVKNPQDAVASFDEIVDILSVVKNNAGEVYWPEFGFNGIGDLIPGQGYQIRVDEAYADFNFQDLDGLRIEIQPTIPQWAIDMETSIHPNDIRTLVRVVNTLGQEVNPESEFEGTLLYYLFNDGSVEKHLK